MRIFMPTDVFPPRCGGSGWSTFYLAKALQKRGHEIEVAVPKPGVRGTSYGRYEGLKIVYVGYRTSRIPLLRNYYKNELFWKEFESFLMQHLPGRFDVIHAQHQMTVVPAARAGKKLALPVIATVRDYWPVCYFGTMYSAAINDCSRGCSDRKALLPLKPAIAAYMHANLRAKQRALQQCTHITAVSSFVKKTLSSIVAANRIDIVPGMMEAVSGVRKESDYVLYAGTLSREKGIPLLLDALAMMKAPPTLLVAGDGPLREAVVRAPSVRVLGRLPHDEVMNYMLRCELLVFPSAWHEPLSRTLIEAAMLGVPVVATNTGGTPDIVADGKTGLLAAPDASDLARKINRLLRDDALRKRLGKNAQRAAKKKYSPKAVVQHMGRVYQKAMQ